MIIHKCYICGMDIHTKSIGLNASTMLEKNSTNALLNCPFCGVSNQFFTVLDDDLEGLVMELSLEAKSIIEKAVKLEVFNSTFYEEASERVDCKILSVTFKELSKIELMHARIHMRLISMDKPPVLHKPDYSNRETDYAFIKEAEAREKHAITFYTKNVENINIEKVKKVFEALRKVESEHNSIMSTKAFELCQVQNQNINELSTEIG